VKCTYGSHIFCRSCDVSKSTTAKINRVSTRNYDPNTCFLTLAIEIRGPVDTTSIGNFSYVFGVVWYKFAFVMVELINSKSYSARDFHNFLTKYNYLVAECTLSELITTPYFWEHIFKRCVKSLT
jgi:hypothetical protein